MLEHNSILFQHVLIQIIIVKLLLSGMFILLFVELHVYLSLIFDWKTDSYNALNKSF